MHTHLPSHTHSHPHTHNHSHLYTHTFTHPSSLHTHTYNAHTYTLALTHLQCTYAYTLTRSYTFTQSTHLHLHTHSHSHSSLRNSRPCMSPLFTELIRKAMPHATSLQTKWGPSMSVLAWRALSLFWAHQLVTCDVCHSRLGGCRAWTAHALQITPQHVSLNCQMKPGCFWDRKFPLSIGVTRGKRHSRRSPFVGAQTLQL